MEPSQAVIPERIGKYNVSRVLGEGAFATVVEAYDTKNYQNVAIKILNRKMIEERKMMEYIEKELRIMSRLNHPSIVKVSEIIYEKDNIYIVMEYMCSGDVFSLLHNGIRLNLKEQLEVAKKIIDDICYLHERGIAHRDINPANILFDESLNPKIADFGLSCESSSYSHTICGTFLFMAPEILKSSKYDARKADVWSLGVVLNIISSNKYPFDNVSQARYFSLVKNDKLIFNIENKGIIGQLIKACLVFDPEERISSYELRNLINSHMKDFENHSTKQLFNHPILPKLIAKNSITRNLLHDHLSIRKNNTFESNFRMVNLASEPMRMSL